MSKISDKQTRRAVLRKSGSVLAGLGSGIIGLRSVSTPAAASESGLEIHGPGSGRTVKYEIWVTGGISKGGDTEPPDTDHGSWVSGEVIGGKDSYLFTGLIREIYLDGPGTATIYSGGNVDSPTYKVDLYTEAKDRQIFYIWNQDRTITERGNSLESSDSIENNSRATGYLSTGSDRFYADGKPQYMSVDSEHQGFHWYAFDF